MTALDVMIAIAYRVVVDLPDCELRRELLQYAHRRLMQRKTEELSNRFRRT